MLHYSIILYPFLASLLLLMVRQSKDMKTLSFLLSIPELVMLLWLYLKSVGLPGYKTSSSLSWLSGYGIDLNMASDGISLVMLFLMSLCFPLIILSGNDEHLNRSGRFHALLFFTMGSLAGVFLAANALVFYIFWELTLLPVFIQILVWGGENKSRITLKFFLYTLSGSLALLFGFIYIFYLTPEPHSFNIQSMLAAPLTAETQQWLFFLLFLGFAVKIPLFPFHSWQPETYTTAPTQVTMVLSALLMKMGIYGMLRWMVPLIPAGIQYWSTPVIVLSLTGMIYASFIALKQDRLKTLIAWSSLAHGGLIGASVFAMNSFAFQGAVFQSFSHALIITGLFIGVMIIEKQSNSLSIKDLGGIRLKAPVFAGLFLIILLGSAGLPATNGFVAEFLMISGLFAINPWLAAFGGLTLIMGAVYMFYAYQKTMLGEARNPAILFTEIKTGTILLLSTIVFFIFLTGLWPGMILDVSKQSIEDIFSTIIQMTNY